MIAAAAMVAELLRAGLPLGVRQRATKGEHRGRWLQRGQTRDGRLLAVLVSDEAGRLRRCALMGLLTPEPVHMERNALVMQIAAGVCWPEGGAAWVTAALVALRMDVRLSPWRAVPGGAVGMATSEAPRAVHLVIVGGEE